MQDRNEKTGQAVQANEATNKQTQMPDEQPLLISDACKQLNMEAHVLRYWEEELQLPIMRNEQGYRCYTHEQLLMFQRIRILRDAGYQLKAIKLVVPRLSLLDEDEFYYIVQLADEMNKRASELPDTLPGILPVPAAQTELAKKLRLEEFEDVMNRIFDSAFERHAARLEETLGEQISTKIIKEVDYLMRLQEDEAEERFRKLDETLLQRRRKTKEQKQAAASRLPWRRTGKRTK